MVQLSIIVLSYNTKDLTIACIDSIIGQYKKQLDNGDFELIVVDNKSSDSTIEAIKSVPAKGWSASGKKRLRLIENKENYGFSKGNNIGAKQANGKFLFFLNSDTKVLDSGLLEMVSYLEQRKPVGILGARLQNVDGSPQASVGSFYNLGNVFIMLLGGERAGLLRSSPQRTQHVDWASGGAMMVKGDMFKKMGGFDENFFMYVEDMELCFRAKKLGFETHYFPDILVEHKTLGSSNRTFAILNIYKGLLYFYKKHFSYVEYLLVRLLLMLKAYMAIFIGLVTQNNYLTSTYKKALAI